MIAVIILNRKEIQTVKHTQYIKRIELNKDVAVFICRGREKIYFSLV